MKQPYHFLTHLRFSWLVLMLVLLSATAQAQSGPYGNEWIVPGQQYYKLKVAQDGLYRLDYQYLTRAGISGVNPQRLQLWRRGKEVAIYVGGNQTALDATTYVEFFGQRNDGVLDRGMYRTAADQPHALYSLYTDTASYFLTWTLTGTGKRMVESNPTATSAPHTTWVQSELRLQTEGYSDIIKGSLLTSQPWAETAEGFMSRPVGGGRDGYGGIPRTTTREVNQLVGRAASGQAPQLEMLIVDNAESLTQQPVITLGTAASPGRALGTPAIDQFQKLLLRYPLQRSEVGVDGAVRVTMSNAGSGQVRIAYLRVTQAQTSRWVSALTQRAFLNDSTLTGPAYYLLDSIPATVHGYDVTDPYNVRRVEGQAGTGQQRGFVFSNTNGQTRRLLLADGAQGRTPLTINQVRFRTLNPATPNFLIVSHQLLMQRTDTSANPVRDYAAYRASVRGGRYDTLVVTSQQLYDQFHYGEKSALAIRQFAQYMLSVNPTRSRYLLLLGKGLITGEYYSGYHRQVTPETFSQGLGRVVRDLVPTSTRAASDIFFTSNWPNNDYVARMATGRVSANSGQEVLNYLHKLKQHEALGFEPWRRNAMHMAGGVVAAEFPNYNAHIDEYSAIIRRPPFAGTVVRTFRRSDYPVTGVAAPIVFAPELNAGLSIISYFGHGGPNELNFSFPDINDNAGGYANNGKYPIMYVSGCSAGNTFTGATSFGERWVLAPRKGFVGFLSETGFGGEFDLHELHAKMYELLFNDPTWYGKPVAEVQNEAVRQLQGTNTAPNSLTQSLMTTVWQGDPAFRLFSPLKPDFQTSNASLQLPATIPVNTAAFDLRVAVRNPGRTTVGQLQIRVTRRFGSQSIPTLVSVRQARRDTTYVISLPNLNLGDISGLNTFAVELDPNNQIDELDETNNQGTITYTFLQGGVTTLSPPEFGIVGATAVRLVGQSNVATTTSRDYAFELDTVQTFNSTLVRRTTINAVMVPEWAVTLPAVAGQDSVVWYWRMKLAAPQTGESPDWATSSFRVINGRTSGGWSQSHVGQFLRDGQAGISVAAPGGRWVFDAGAQQGIITSTRIGPARQWETLYHTIRPGATGSYTLQLTGIDTLGNEVVLNPNVTSRTQNLSAISAKLYPYLQLQAVVQGGAAAPQLEQWLITYQGVPEGVVRPSATPLTSVALTQQAQQTGKISVPVTFQNVADFDFTAPLKAYILVRTDNSTTAPQEKYFNLTGPALTAHTQRTYQVELDTRNLTGNLSGQIVLNPRRQPEQYYFNNELALPPFQVASQDTPPVLDVAFDGRHLLNGDIVSPQPLITVQLRDQDRLRPIKDRTAFSLFLSAPNSTATTALNLNAANVVFTADSAQGMARLEIQLGKDAQLADGIYTLEVQGKDGSGNLAGSEPYRITFEVITKTGITNVFPYPNPVTSKAKFVFTLTGAEPPRNMKIQILTLTGRVVREIMMSELGNLRIGNNITDYAWDGTDTYGDRLANGTYLYRVILDDPTNQFEQRETAADKAFKKGWGKIVLLR